jgi:hypothetical protein
MTPAQKAARLWTPLFAVEPTWAYELLDFAVSIPRESTLQTFAKNAPFTFVTGWVSKPKALDRGLNAQIRKWLTITIVTLLVDLDSQLKDITSPISTKRPASLFSPSILLQLLKQTLSKTLFPSVASLGIPEPWSKMTAVIPKETLEQSFSQFMFLQLI